MLDFRDVLGRVGELEADPFAKSARREAPALNDGHFMRHLSVQRIVRDHVNAGLWDDIARPVFLRHIPFLLILQLLPGTGGEARRSATTLRRIVCTAAGRTATGGDQRQD
jgi:hypothetical protein